MSWRAGVGAAASLSLALLPACTGSSAAEDCAESGSCALGFVHDDVQYGIGCLGVAPEKLGFERADVRVNSTGDMTPLRAVKGWDPQQALAVQLPTSGCGNTGDGTSDWSLAFPLRGPAGWPEQERISCDVALAGPERRTASGCGMRAW